jgi:hypothetical protein
MTDVNKKEGIVREISPTSLKNKPFQKLKTSGSLKPPLYGQLTPKPNPQR